MPNLTTQQALDALVDGVPRLIAENERMRKERDEAVEIVRAYQERFHWDGHAVDAFLARIDQGGAVAGLPKGFLTTGVDVQADSVESLTTVTCPKCGTMIEVKP